MNKRIIYISVFLIGIIINLYNFTDVFGDTAIPKFRPFGNSTTFTDSTSYVTLSKGFYAFDSIKTDKDLIVKGAIVLDTNRLGKFYYVDNELYIVNGKTSSANMVFVNGYGNSYYQWLKQRSLGVNTQLMQLDTASGLTVITGNIQVNGTTQQIKLPSDTATDYDANDNITLNRQSGFLTTKSLTTAGLASYTLTWTNSLISTNTKIFAVVNSTISAGTPLVQKCVSGSGSCSIVIYNAHAVTGLNNTVQVSVVVFN